MLTWKQFFESKENKKIEDLEEKLGIDLDGDEEKGESKEHKEKIKKTAKKKETVKEKLDMPTEKSKTKKNSKTATEKK